MANPYIFIGICDIHILKQCNGAMEDRQNNLVFPSKKIYGLKLEKRGFNLQSNRTPQCK